jgi:dipeptidyl aminopeptidase/acylaminoacyl peptidase
MTHYRIHLHSRAARLAACAALLGLIAFDSSSATDQPKRALRFDDLFAQEQIEASNSWSIAADRALAVTIDRAVDASEKWQGKHSDVWVQLAPDQAMINITRGQADDSDWRDPVWSASGSRLVLQSSRGGKRTLWLWDRTTRELTQLTDRALAGAVIAPTRAFYEWLDDDHVIATAFPPGLQGDEFATEAEPIARIKAGWAQFQSSGKPSVSVLESGAPERPSKDSDAGTPPARLLRQIISVDVRNHAAKLIVDTYPAAQSAFFSPSLSPDGKFIAFSIHGRPVSNGYHEAGGTGTVAIYATDGHAVAFDRPIPADALTALSLHWSVDGTRLAFFAYGDTRASGAKLVIANPAKGKLEVRDLKNIAVTEMRDRQWDYAHLEWTETGDIVCFAGAGEKALEKFARRDWWLISGSAPPRNLTGRLAVVPEFERLSQAGPLIGLAQGTLWRLDAKHQTVEKVATLPQSAASQIFWPSRLIGRAAGSPDRSYIIAREDRPSRPAVIVENNEGDEKQYYYIDTVTGQTRLLTAPHPDLFPVRVDAALKTIYWVNKKGRDYRNLSNLIWTSSTDVVGSQVSAHPLVELNAWRRSIITPPDTVIHYTSLDGQAAQAWVQLPVGYQPEHRYPVIFSVYPGQGGSRGDELVYYSELAAAAGFVVIYPQMGFDAGRHYGIALRDIYFGIANGVLPAVEKAVTLGIADPERLFVEGISAGGFATLTLLEQSARFKAAVAVAGVFDWASGWGTFAPMGRYGEDISRLEIGAMGEYIQERPATASPWSDPSLYQRNSPLTYVDRVRAPVLLIHGDQDSNVPMTQSEQMFSGLLRLQKRTSFVRYWGETHRLENPANIRDSWERRFAWFDEFGDIARDSAGHMIFEGASVKSRGGGMPLQPADYEHFEVFQPGGDKAGLD